jgi:hypothetical protein
VYIHLGWVTPRTKDESREHGNALMHSKVLLAEGAQGCRLWVGSHNLTARALGGANLEAAVIVEGTMQDQPLADARLHLLHCRDTAELFDPKRIPEYKAIQERRAQPPPGLSKDPVLVIHATVPADWQPPSAPFRVHLSLVPMLFDNYFDVDRQVRLFLHPPGTIKHGEPIDLSKAYAWAGMQTAVVRTARHRNRGTQGTFQEADLQVIIPNSIAPPLVVGKDEPLPDMTSQILMRFTHQVPPGVEAYPLKTGAAQSFLTSTGEEHLMGEVENSLKSAFMKDSLKDGLLRFQPVKRMGSSLMIQGYTETMKTLGATDSNAYALDYRAVEPKHPIDPFFFMSKALLARTGLFDQE